MFLFSKYFLFIAIGIVICFVPVILKLIKKKKYGLTTFFVMMVIFSTIAVAYYVLQEIYMNFF